MPTAPGPRRTPSLRSVAALKPLGIPVFRLLWSTWLTASTYDSGPWAGLRPWSSAVTVRSVARPSAPSRSSSISSTGPSPGGGSSPLPEIRTAS